MKYENQTFENETIHIDDNGYLHCTFKNCKIVYGGSEHITMTHCTFENTSWLLEKNAAATAKLLRSVFGVADEPVISGLKTVLSKITEDDE